MSLSTCNYYCTRINTNLLPASSAGTLGVAVAPALCRVLCSGNLTDTNGQFDLDNFVSFLRGCVYESNHPSNSGYPRDFYHWIFAEGTSGCSGTGWRLSRWQHSGRAKCALESYHRRIQYGARFSVAED